MKKIKLLIVFIIFFLFLWALRPSFIRASWSCTNNGVTCCPTSQWDGVTCWGQTYPGKCNGSCSGVCPSPPFGGGGIKMDDGCTWVWQAETPTCTYGEWIPQASCGNGCSPTQRFYTRTYSPSNCSPVGQTSGCFEAAECAAPPCDPNNWGGWSACSASCGGGTQSRTNACGTTQTQSCNTQPCYSCTVSLTPDPASIQTESAVGLIASVTIGSGSVDYVSFSSANSSVASVSPSSDSSPVYSTVATGVNQGTTTATAAVVMGGAIRCTDTSTVSVIPPGPWWQVKDADVITNGSLISLIPGSCSGSCSPLFILNGGGGYPGVALYGGTYDFSASTTSQGTGLVSSTNWLANSIYLGRTYDYSYFARQIAADVPLTEINQSSASCDGSGCTVNGGFFNSGGTPKRGYTWYHFNGSLGDLTISGNVNLNGSRKVMLLVEGANLNITGRINIAQPGNGFFMVAVGKKVDGTKGDILVDPSVSHPNQPALEGIYFADGKFKTGAGSDRLYVRGAVTAWGGMVLQRDLGVNNSNTPAEFFEYAPELRLSFPREFSRSGIVWREVAP